MLACLTSCMTAGLPKQQKKKEDQLLFSEAQKALDARDYVDAIDLFQLFSKKFPKSDQYTWALQRLGESFEGLLELEYRTRLNNGEPEDIAAKQFLSKYGRYSCWEESSEEGLTYNQRHYKMILEKFPDSSIADEAAYRLIPWQKDYHSRPEGPLQELKHLEEIIERYPATSLRPEILYKMSRRCHILYEIYAFPRSGSRDADKAEQYRQKAFYLYKLVLNSPRHSKYSQKAWQDLNLLEKGKRIYILE